MKKKTKPGKTRTNNNDRTFVVILLDRTGSMADVKQETISGFNGYLDELNKKPESKNIVLHMTQFDTAGIDVLHDGVPLNKVSKLDDATYIPRDWTNLYDAIGTTIRRVEEKAKGYKVLFVTITDGKNNASREWTHSEVIDLIKEKEDKDKWTFSYIGIGKEAWVANEQFAAGTAGVSNVLRTTGKNVQRAYAFAAQGTMLRCGTAGGQSVSHLYEDKHLDEDES